MTGSNKSSDKKDKDYGSEAKDSYSFEEEIKRIIRDKITKDPDKFIEKVLGKFKDHWVFGKRSFMSWQECPDINPFVNMILTRSGLLPLYTLHLLEDKEMFGNEIINEIEKRTSAAWSPNPGAIYPLLKELEEKRFVEGRWDLNEEHPRRIYKLTDKGKQEYKILKIILEKHLNQAIGIFKKIYKELFPGAEN